VPNLAQFARIGGTAQKSLSSIAKTIRKETPEEGLSLSMWLLNGLGRSKVPGSGLARKASKGIGASIEAVESLPEKAPSALKKGRVWKALFGTKVKTPVGSTAAGEGKVVSHVLEEDLLRTSKVPSAAMKYIALPMATFTGAHQMVDSFEKKGEQVDEQVRTMLLSASDALRKCASEIKLLRAQNELKEVALQKIATDYVTATEKSVMLEKKAAAREIADKMAQAGLIGRDDILEKAASLETEEDLGACAKAVELIDTGEFGSFGTIVEDEEVVKEAKESMDPLTRVFLRHMGKDI